MDDVTLILDETSDIEAFLTNPIGRCLRRASFSYWYPQRGFTGFALLGHPSAIDIRDLNRAMDVVLPPRSDAHISLVDTSRLEGVGEEAFAAMEAYLLKHQQSFAELIQRQALVRPSGVVGAVVAGFYRVVPTSYPAQVFDNFTDAVDWLGLPQPRKFMQFLLALQSANKSDRVLTQLREHLCNHLADTSLQLAAKALCVSVRTLQRRLTN